MLQNFLAERFQMVTHWKTKESQVYEFGPGYANGSFVVCHR